MAEYEQVEPVKQRNNTIIKTIVGTAIPLIGIFCFIWNAGGITETFKQKVLNNTDEIKKVRIEYQTRYNELSSQIVEMNKKISDLSKENVELKATVLTELKSINKSIDRIEKKLK